MSTGAQGKWRNTVQDDDTHGPLHGIRVIDLTTARAGPTCVRQLADMGADAVQVISPDRGDFGGSDAANLHRNKRSVIIDLRAAEGREVFLDLVRNSDVLVENFRPAVKHRLGIAPEQLWAVNERLVYASISGFGQDGPYADRWGLDHIAQGMGGLMSVTGPPGRPWRAGIAVTDSVSGMLLAQAVTAALFERERSGRGQWVYTSLLETMVTLLDFQAARWTIDGDVPAQTGNQHPSAFPDGGATLRTADGFVNVAPLRNYRQFCAAIGAPELAEDPRYATRAARDERRAEFEELLDDIFSKRTTAEWVEILVPLIPCGPVYTIDEVFDDPQVRHLDLVAPVADRDGREVGVLRHPVTFSRTATSIRAGVAVTGSGTRQVLAELGYAPERIASLLATGAVGERSDNQLWSD